MLFKKHGYLTKWKRQYRALDSKTAKAAARLTFVEALNGMIKSRKVLSIIDLYSIN